MSAKIAGTGLPSLYFQMVCNRVKVSPWYAACIFYLSITVNLGSDLAICMPAVYLKLLICAPFKVKAERWALPKDVSFHIS